MNQQIQYTKSCTSTTFIKKESSKGLKYLDKVTTKYSTEHLHLEKKPVTDGATDVVNAVEKKR